MEGGLATLPSVGGQGVGVRLKIASLHVVEHGGPRNVDLPETNCPEVDDDF